MGSSLAPIIANIFMSDLEESAKNEAGKNKLTTPCMHLRYVDDCLDPYTGTEEEFKQYMALLNNINPKIQFTYEKEAENGLPFLDCLIKIENGKVTTTVFRKPTNTDAYLNARCHHNPQVKRGIVKTLMLRAKKLCSTREKLSEERTRVHKALMLNGYSSKMITSVGTTEGKQKQKTENSTQTVIGTLRIPHITGVTNKIQRIMRKHNIKTTTTVNNTLYKQLVRKKPEETQMDKSNVVYQIKCKDCDKSYIGETKRPLKRRITEHKRAIKQQRTDNSEIAQHVWYENHQQNIENPVIIASERRTKARKIKEAILTKQFKSYNRTQFDISGAWARSLKTIKI
jgi:predicted GIY-YIG superfamily endonuclease